MCLSQGSAVQRAIKNLLVYEFLFLNYLLSSSCGSCGLAFPLLGKLGSCFWKTHYPGPCELLMASFRGQILKVGRMKLMAAKCKSI